MTDTITMALSVPAVTVTVVAPTAMAVRTPSVLPTVATAGFAEDHWNDVFVALPVASIARATRRSTPPVMSDGADGEIKTATGGSGNRTETAAAARSVPAVAVTVVVPGAIATT